MKIMVTGGSGFIGRNIQESFMYKKYELLCPSHKELDLLDFDAVAKYLSIKRPNILIHTASVYEDTLEDLHTNISMYNNLIQNFQGHRVINCSSGAAFDASRSLLDVCEKELGDYIPKDAYGLSKYCIVNIKPHRPTYHLHLFGVFGKYELNDRFITRSINRIVEGMYPFIYADRKMNYVYIKDLIKIIDIMIEYDHGNTVDYVVSSSESYMLTQIADMICSLMDIPKEYITLRGDNKPSYTGSNRLLLSDFPSIEFTPLKESIRKYIKEDLCL